MANKPGLNNQYPSVFRSLEMYEQIKHRIPGGTQTLAKGASQYVLGAAPLYLTHGKGSHVWDVDGNEFVDFNMGIGAVSLGYCHPKVDEAITTQLKSGISFSLVHPLEGEVAEKVSDLIPGAESIRFSKTGADVTSAAIRLARAYTGRKKIIACGYHGWHDWYVSLTTRNKGIPPEIASLSSNFVYNDISSLEKLLDSDTAAVILEPLIFEAPKPGFLQAVKEACQKAGALLIFDEMWTGFRVALGGAQEKFDVQADLSTFSKAIANGMPLSVLTGRRDVMSLVEDDVFFYTTFGGETLSLAAASATMDVLEDEGGPEHFEKIGRWIQEGVASITKRLGLSYIQCQGLPFRTLMNFDATTANPLLMKSFVQQELLKWGILWSGTHTLCLSHEEKDIELLLQAYEDVLARLDTVIYKKALESSLRGRPIQPVFRTTTGKTK